MSGMNGSTELGATSSSDGKGPKFEEQIRQYRVDVEMVVAKGSIVVWARGLDHGGAATQAIEALESMPPEERAKYLGSCAELRVERAVYVGQRT